MFRLIGLDNGFASIGYAVMVVDGTRARIAQLGVFYTQKSNKKQNVLTTEDNLRRAIEIAKFFRELLAAAPSTVAFCAEGMSFPRSSSVAAKMAFAWGVLASLSEATRVPVLQGSPQFLKKTVCGKKNASKEEIRDAVVKLYPEIKAMRARLNVGEWEHAHDAVAAAHTILVTAKEVQIAQLAAS